MSSAERGLSVVESLVVTLLLAGVLALGSSLFAGATRTFSRETSRVFLQQDVTAAVNMILDDLSVAGHRPDDLLASAAGAYATLPASQIFESVDLAGGTDTVSFRADVDSDGTTDRICYRVRSGTLTRAVTDVGTSCASIWADPSDAEEETLLEQVQSFDLTFLAADRSVLAAADVQASGARFSSGSTWSRGSRPEVEPSSDRPAARPRSGTEPMERRFPSSNRVGLRLVGSRCADRAPWR